jgi:hypothetical protein
MSWVLVYNAANYYQHLLVQLESLILAQNERWRRA